MKLPWRSGRSAPTAAGGRWSWVGSDIEPGRFFEGEHVIRRIAPFAIVGVVPFLLLPAIGAPVADWRVGLALAILLGILGSAVLTPWERLPAWTQTVPVLAAFAVIALLRDAAGADAAIFEPLVIVPITWLTLYGTRAQLCSGIAVMVAILAVPPIVGGPPTYEDDQIVRAGIAAVIAATAGFAVQTLVAATRGLAIEARAVLETAQDAFVSVNDEMAIVEWNPIAERTFGWSRSEAIGRDFDHDPDPRKGPRVGRRRCCSASTRPARGRSWGSGWRRGEFDGMVRSCRSS